MPDNTSAPARKAKFLSDAIAHQVDSFSKKRKSNRAKAFWSNILSTSFSAFTTILLGLQGIENSNLIIIKNTALIFSACVTVLATWEAFFSHRELWVRYTTTLTNLKAIQSDLAYLLTGNPNPPEEKIDELYLSFCSVLKETNTNWLSLRGQTSIKHSTTGDENESR